MNGNTLSRYKVKAPAEPQINIYCSNTQCIASRNGGSPFHGTASQWNRYLTDEAYGSTWLCWRCGGRRFEI